MNQTVLITGATGAIGSATARVLARQGCHLILLARNQEKLETVKNQIRQESAQAEVKTFVVDFTDLGALKKTALEIQKDLAELHALIHNAAVFKSTRTLTGDGLETMFAVNHLAPFMLTKVLFETLHQTRGSRILTVTAPSTTRIDFQDPMGERRFNALNAFGATKMANLLFAFKLGRAGVTSHALHPGLVRSDLLREASPFIRIMGSLVSGSPEKTAAAFSEIVLEPRYIQSNGQFWHLKKPIQAPAYARDPQNQDALWDLSLKWINTLEVRSR
ncbi:SDR family NAD(P)-dependent oxidoreductase [Deinococcus cellulosilyticus]|uniref:Short-chain dehydrogenase n=1 Tax=Deinococcus cellulosilyticus (strain DSM 18568 / NBRC 106333 / KACC 11606 / 5516J-15) TaxID=1223518 RepID=A0A511N5I7_DEIC1|nr:SDR family NAD(P)-dependent oxidoreductase [Deinococcus cellulosilyticus]GEM48113.1 short-chain dehydrogenase [Deinococcus cellulosilyticus NBRC 106333 = KACC 11606]